MVVVTPRKMYKSATVTETLQNHKQGGYDLQSHDRRVAGRLQCWSTTALLKSMRRSFGL